LKYALLGNLLATAWAIPAIVGNGTRPAARPYTVKQRLLFRAGDERAAEMLRQTPARRLVRGPFLLAMIDLDDDGSPELVIQKLPRSAGATTRSTMVLKRFDGGYGAVYYSRLSERLAVTNEKSGRYRALAELDAGGGIRIDKDFAAADFGRQKVYEIQ